jgi:GNAT superfamily N-acetyltransferase
MPTPTLLGMLFVHPTRLRQGIGTELWKFARSRLESEFKEVRTVELNSTPCAVEFYRALGFVPISAEFVPGGSRATRIACWLPLYLPRCGCFARAPDGPSGRLPLSDLDPAGRVLPHPGCGRSAR